MSHSQIMSAIGKFGGFEGERERCLDDEHNNLFNLGHLPRPNGQWDQSCFHF